MPLTVEIQPKIIDWAISRSGYDKEEFFSEFPKIQTWREGEQSPTLSQLRKFAKKTRVPFGYLLLKNPPAEELPIPFFRTTDNNINQVAVNLRDTILTLQKRQEWLSEYLIDQGAQPLDFIGKFTTNTAIEKITEDIRKTLNLSNNWATHHPNWEKALQHLSERIEEAGIFMVFNSVVGLDNHRPIEVDECRGFVLCSEIAPFLFVNAADAKAAQMFTIAHELAHLWIGVSAGFDFRRLQPANNAVENFCDAVAAEFLVPSALFEQKWTDSADFNVLAKFFKVSQIVIARRALDLGKIDREDFFDFYQERMDWFAQIKARKGDGGNFYNTLRKKINLRFLATLNRAVKENKILYKHAYQLSGLRGTTYAKAVKEYNL